jgi:hypothetical protein
MKERKRVKSKNIKNALLGIVLALVATYMYIVAVAVLIGGARGVPLAFSVIPFVVLFYTSWVVIPSGVALGMLIPRIAFGKTRWMAALQGAVLGAVTGLLALFCLGAVYPLELRDSFVMSVIAYCALWVGAYAGFRAKGQSLYR